jgi:DNA-binding protein H-NS
MTDYENMSRKELMEMRARIDRAIAAVADRDKRNALKAAEAAAREHGYSLEELVESMGTLRGRGRGRAAAKASGGDATVRYRNPDDPTQTWSGRGRRPGWIKEAEGKGRSLDEMRVA